MMYMVDVSNNLLELLNQYKEYKFANSIEILYKISTLHRAKVKLADIKVLIKKFVEIEDQDGYNRLAFVEMIDEVNPKKAVKKEKQLEEENNKLKEELTGDSEHKQNYSEDDEDSDDWGDDWDDDDISSNLKKIEKPGISITFDDNMDNINLQLQIEKLSSKDVAFVENQLLKIMKKIRM